MRMCVRTHNCAVMEAVMVAARAGARAGGEEVSNRCGRAKAGANVEHDALARACQSRAHGTLDGARVAAVARRIFEHRTHHAVLAAHHGARVGGGPREARGAVDAHARRREHERFAIVGARLHDVVRGRPSRRRDDHARRRIRAETRG